jgi:hypothetical protein
LFIARGDHQFDIASLRQGDILEGVPFPLLELAKVNVLGAIAQSVNFDTVPQISPKTHQHRDDPDWTTAVVPVRFGFCAVLSNCCDLEPRNGRVQTHAVALARLRPIPNDIRSNSALFGSLRANKDPRDRNDPGYIEYFYLQAHELLQGADWRVHYSQIVTLPTTDIMLLLRKKILQLSDRERMKFKIKLGFTLMRPSEEEIRAGLEDPWRVGGE